MKRHRLPKGLATTLSKCTRHVHKILDEHAFKEHQLSKQRSMMRCITALGNGQKPWTCKYTKMCPRCRTDLMMRAMSGLHNLVSDSTRPVYLLTKVSDKKENITRPPSGTQMTLRNWQYNQEKPRWEYVAAFIGTEPTSGCQRLLPSMIPEVVRSVIGWDYYVYTTRLGQYLSISGERGKLVT